MGNHKSNTIIMKRNSKTFFNSSLFFPKAVRSKVMTLYAFVRTADDFVDAVPQDKDGFIEFRNQYKSAMNGIKTNNFIIDDFAALVKESHIQNDWVESFLDSMEQDIYKIEYKTLAETEAYMYGSAEVVGLMMARVLSLSDESFEYARLLGRAFQYLNIIRDVKEDIEMGRVYIPIDEIQKAGFDKLTLTSADDNPEAFNKLIQKQIEYYKKWYAEAVNGYKYIPRRYLIAIKTAADMFDLTASIIYADPKIIMQRKVKPNKIIILAKGIQNLFAISLSHQNAPSKEPITDMEKP